ALTRRPVDALASNVCGSVLGLLMMALACTYIPPTCAMTSAYSFSAPTAMILPPAPGWSAADEDVQPAASRAAPARAAHARMALGSIARLLRRFGMAGFSQVCGCRCAGVSGRSGCVASNDNDSHFCLQRDSPGREVAAAAGAGLPAPGSAGLPERGERRAAG